MSPRDKKKGLAARLQRGDDADTGTGVLMLVIGCATGALLLLVAVGIVAAMLLVSLDWLTGM